MKCLSYLSSIDSYYFYREKEMRRLKARAEGNHLEWGYRELQSG